MHTGRLRLLAGTACAGILVVLGSGISVARAHEPHPPLPSSVGAEEFRTPGGTTVYLDAWTDATGQSTVCVHASKVLRRTDDRVRVGVQSGCSTEPIEYHFDSVAWTATVSAEFPATYHEYVTDRAGNLLRLSKEVQRPTRISATWTGTSPPTVRPVIGVGGCYVLPPICGGPGLTVARRGTVEGRMRLEGLAIGVRTPPGLPGTLVWGYDRDRSAP